MTEVKFIDDERKLSKFIAEALDSKHIAYDSEFIPEDKYRPELCLMQFAIDSGVYVVDALTIEKLEPVKDLIERSEAPWIVHSAEEDLAILHDVFGAIPTRIFDTQIAHAFLSTTLQIGYARLIHKLLGVSVSKKEKLFDWRKRPLPEAMLNYAASDVEHLIPSYELLSKNLEDRERREWAEEECQRLLRKVIDRGKDHGPLYERVRGWNSVPQRELSVLNALCVWREAKARSSNIPPSRVMADATLIALAKSCPRTEGDLASLRGVGRSAKRHGAEVVEQIVKGLEERGSFKPETREDRDIANSGSARGSLIQALVKDVADRMSVASSLLLPSALNRLVSSPGWEEVMESCEWKGWRRGVILEQVVDLLSGRIRVGLDKKGRIIATKI
ncbi:MAG: HRDC domain-containing protein [Planctomycetes bacterium]|nr:HRDC domain-containing protein [Planctomycetota bacterium]